MTPTFAAGLALESLQ